MDTRDLLFEAVSPCELGPGHFETDKNLTWRVEGACSLTYPSSAMVSERVLQVNNERARESGEQITGWS